MGNRTRKHRRSCNVPKTELEPVISGKECGDFVSIFSLERTTKYKLHYSKTWNKEINCVLWYDKNCFTSYKNLGGYFKITPGGEFNFNIIRYTGSHLPVKDVSM